MNMSSILKSMEIIEISMMMGFVLMDKLSMSLKLIIIVS